ncbi:MAG: nucleotide exchange factor GrpE [Bacilli bacterium]|jgi:molecular chaperone GrpE|nr:nucleotide exchange factor GrpE [Bacilli bacterium]
MNAEETQEKKEETKTEAPKASPETAKPEEKKADISPEIKQLQESLAKMTEKFQTAEKNFEDADKAVETWKNKYYEAYADMANVRKQVDKETDDFKKYANESFIKEFIPALDSFDLALAKEQSDPAVKKYLEGFQMIDTKIVAVLKSHGAEILEAKPGDTYDPNIMEAFSTVEGKEDNKVVEAFLKGYRFHDHLLRPCGVVISRKAAPAPKEETKAETKAETKTETKAETK